MIDSFVLLAPILLLGVVALLGFVGCQWIVGTDFPPRHIHPKAVAGSSAKVTVSWNEVSDADSYNVNQTGGPAPRTFKVVNATAFTDTSVAIGTTYTYTVDAFQDTQQIAQSAENVSATPGPITFQPPLAETAETTVAASIKTPALANVAPRSLVVVWIYYNSTATTVQTVQDSSSPDQYQPAAGPTTVMGAVSSFRQEIWYKNDVAGGPNFAVTATFSPSLNAVAAIVAHVYHTYDPTATPEISRSATGSGSVASSGLVQVDSAKLIFGAAIFLGGGGTPGTPEFRQRATTNNNISEDEDFDAPGTAEATFNTVPSGSTQDWIAQMVAFR